MYTLYIDKQKYLREIITQDAKCFLTSMAVFALSFSSQLAHITAYEFKNILCGKILILQEKQINTVIYQRG